MTNPTPKPVAARPHPPAHPAAPAEGARTSVPAGKTLPDRRPRPDLVPRMESSTPFLRRYEVALRFCGLHHYARHIGLLLACTANWTSGQISPERRLGNDKLAAAAGLSTWQVRVCLDKLADAGLLRKTSLPGSDARVIELLIPPDLDPVLR